MSALDFCEIALEESPLNENTWDDAATPSRVSTDKLYIPFRSARLSPAPGHLDRADEQRGILAAPPRLIETYSPSGAIGTRGYWKLLTWLLELAGFEGVVTAGGAGVTDPTATTVVGVNALDSATINVVSTAGFLDSGAIVIGANTITYTGKTATSFTGCGSHPATVGGETVNQNVPAGAQKWVFSKRDSIDAQTAQIKLNHRFPAVLLQGNGYSCSGLSLNAAGEVAADLLGLYLQRLAVDTTTVPSYESQDVPPLRRGELFLDWLANGGKPSDFSLAIASPLAQDYDHSQDPPSDFPSILEHGDEQVMVTGSIPKRVLDATDYDALLDASTFAATARWKSSKVIGATAYPYAVWFEMPACQYVGGDAEEHGNRKRVGATYDFFAAYSEGDGFDVKITLVNDVAAIKTFA